MSNVTETSIPPAWYADPADASKLRWWDGGAWTARVADRPSAAPVIPQPPVEYAAAQSYDVAQLPRRQGWAPAPLKTHETRRSSLTVSSWFLATELLWAGIPAGFVAAFVATDYPSLASLTNILIVGLIGLGLARLDGNRLEAQSFRRPPSALVLLMPIYFIIRTARVGAGGAAVMVVHFIALGVWVGALVWGYPQMLAFLGL